MKIRRQLFEFEDLPWFPQVIRAGMMDYLRFMISKLGTYQPVVPLLREALRATGQRQLLELCAGAGGGTENVVRTLRQEHDLADTSVTLSDLYPQPAAWQLLAQRNADSVRYTPDPVDATAVPAGLPGFRLVFSAFHHFAPPAAEALLADAVRQRTGIGVFEGAGKHWHEILLAWTVLPVLQLLATPFMRPFRWSRLFFTYVVPLIPLCTIWDGTVSILRMYPPAQLLALARRADPGGQLEWQAGKVRHWSGSPGDVPDRLAEAANSVTDGLRLLLTGYVPSLMSFAAYRRALPLLRIPFSIYLMPVFWFGLSALPGPLPTARALGVFVVLHLLAYPASNGYNSYYDRDEGSIGGLKRPPKVSAELLHLVWLFDALAVVGALLLSPAFAGLLLTYLLVSKAYSYEGIRLKKYPLLSTLVVVVFQGAFTFLMAQVGVGAGPTTLLAPTNLQLALVSSLFLCGSYPLTQVYQHTEDRQRGDQTLSLLLGIRGTFGFAALGLLAGAAVLALTYWQRDELRHVLIFLVAASPVVILFGRWAWQVWHDAAAADFEHTMLMNQVSSLCLSAAFGLMLVL